MKRGSSIALAARRVPIPIHADGTEASCEPPPPPKVWTFGDQQREWPHILGREAHEVWRATWVAYLRRLAGDDEDAKRAADAFLWLAPYDDLPEPERAAWDAAAQASYEHGERDAKEEAEEADARAEAARRGW